MEFLEVIVLGVVQGLTEFLPVSSSGHLVFVPELFGWEGRGLRFDAMIHLGTFVAVLVYFWKEVKQMVAGALGSKKHRKYGKLGWMVIAATIPVVIVGLFFADTIDSMLYTTGVVAASLIIWGVVLAAADILSRLYKPKVKKDTGIGWGRAMAVGLAQVISLIPGTSRSGITMSMGLLSGMDRKTAARFSFLLSIPAVGGAGIYVTMRSFMDGAQMFDLEMLVAFLAALVSGLLAIKVLLKVIEKWSFLPFAAYRIILGILILLFL